MVGKNENSGAFARLQVQLGGGWLFPPCRLQMAEAARALSEQKAQSLGELLAAAEQEQQSLAQRQAKEHRLEQQVSREGWAGTGWATGQAMPAGVTGGDRCPVTHRRRQSGSLSSSETYPLPTRRTCFCETRYGGVGPGLLGGGGRGLGAGAGAAAAHPWCRLSRWTSWSGR